MENFEEDVKRLRILPVSSRKYLWDKKTIPVPK
jgi:hypothetical protein